MHEYRAKIINYHKWEALINFLREKERKLTRRREKKEKKKKDCVFARPSLELTYSHDYISVNT